MPDMLLIVTSRRTRAAAFFSTFSGFFARSDRKVRQARFVFWDKIGVNAPQQGTGPALAETIQPEPSIAASCRGGTQQIVVLLAEHV
jgi:hypothetical protein